MTGFFYIMLSYLLVVKNWNNIGSLYQHALYSTEHSKHSISVFVDSMSLVPNLESLQIIICAAT